MSGYTPDSAPRRDVLDGMTTFLTKPFDEAELLSALEEAVRKRR
jgi:FixJ family two-component response regulator